MGEITIYKEENRNNLTWIFDSIKTIGKEASPSPMLTFWLMHLDFNLLIKKLKNVANTKGTPLTDNMESIIGKAKSTVIMQYSNKFEKDLKTCFRFQLDDIYQDISLHMEGIFFQHNEENHRLIPTFCWRKTLQNLKENDITVDRLYSDLLNLLEETNLLHSRIKEFANKFPTYCEFKNKALPLPSDIVRLYDKYASKKTKTNEENSKDLQNMCEELSKLQKSIESLYKILQTLILETNDDKFAVAISFCKNNLKDFTKWQEYAINRITLWRYALGGGFNYESILIFLFSKYNKESAGTILTTIVDKHQKLFLNMREILYNASSQTKELLEEFTGRVPTEITNEYYQLNIKFDKTKDNRLLLFKLKKLISLYHFYIGTTKQNEIQCINVALNTYNYILKETRLLSPSYLTMLDDLPSYVMNTFGLSQTDLANILGVGNHTITREKNNLKLLQNHQWFWNASTGFTYTYLLGETTIPDYGKLNSDDDIYGIGVMGQMTYAELFLQYVSDLSNYKRELEKNNSRKTKYVLKKEYIENLSGCIFQFMEEIKKYRIALDNLYNWKETLKKENSKRKKKISKEIKSISFFNKQTKLEALKKEKERLEKEIENAENFFEKTSSNFLRLLNYVREVLSISDYSKLNNDIESYYYKKQNLEKSIENERKAEDFDSAKLMTKKTQKEYDDFWLALKPIVEDQENALLNFQKALMN